MKNTPKRIRNMMLKCGNMFKRLRLWEKPAPWDSKAYYISFDGFVLEMKPYYGWKNARKAAKAKHSRAFIMSGKTLNRNLLRARNATKGDMRSWNYGSAS